MKYYKVKPYYDNFALYKNDGGRLISAKWFLIGDELYTEDELNKMDVWGCEAVYGYEKVHVTPALFEQIHIPEDRTYHFFGSRFAEDNV